MLTLNLSYDYENRLNSVIANSGDTLLNYSLPQPIIKYCVPGISSYTYDGEGRRISSINGTTITNYLYDGLDVILERNASNDPVVSYLRNPYAAGGIGGIVMKKLFPLGSQEETVSEEYYTYDGLGSVSNLSDATGVNIQDYRYDAFGNLIPSPLWGGSGRGDDSNTHQFLTKESDPSGFIYFGARYYDPAIGRFITEDPLGMIDGPNMYLYASNDPVNLVDLWGLDTYYVNYELIAEDHKPTQGIVSHSYVALTDNGIVTNTFSYGNKSQGKWFPNDPQDMRVAQEAIKSRVGAEWQGNESLDYYVALEYEKIKNSRSTYFLFASDCKVNAIELIKRARKTKEEREKRCKK